ncbi:MAG TPA: putative glycoside hydrolase [Turneriella sp.]|nr:putative glycoside hydrolase [Turneriella sp.]
MFINQRPFSFFFILAFVSLYSSMTCLRNEKTLKSAYAQKQSEPIFTTNTDGETVALANTAPASQPTQDTALPLTPKSQREKRVNPTDAKSLLTFIEKLQHHKFSWAHFPLKRPNFVKGIYLTNATASNPKSFKHFVDRSKEYKLNAMVIDTQGRKLTTEQMSYIKSQGIYPIARVVCFDLGLKTQVPNTVHLDKIMASVEEAAQMGFPEIQLDYIRYADEPKLLRLPLKFKYEQISKVLDRARKLTDSLGVELGADVFGRITLNQHDQIGQRLEVFGEYVQNLYPMVYPSHYYGDPEKIADPYGTVKEGVANSKERIPKTRIIAWIQGFAMKIKESGLALPEYVLQQFYAIDDAGGDGYIVWNARNDYSATWKALKEYERLAPTRKKAHVQKERIDKQG